MVISRAPFRMSFFGGGTDYPPFFEEHGGAVISTTINKYCYSIIRSLPPFFDYHTQVKYARTESVRKTEELEHPLVRNAMLHTGVHNVSLLYDADLPARSGLGTSSSFAVALLQGLYAMKGQYASKEQLAKEAIYVERTLCNESGGWQDQVAAAFGGLNRIDFSKEGFTVRPIVISPERKKKLEGSMLLFFTGVARNSFEVAKEQLSTVKDKTAELLEMKKLTDRAEEILTSDTDVNEFGRLLDEAWQLKRNISGSITTDYIDSLYKKGRDAGAIGGKLLGAGGGGFMLFFAEPDKHEAILEAFKDHIYVPVHFENEGVKVVLYTDDLDHKPDRG